MKKRYETAFHGVPIVFAISTAIAALVLNMFNEASLWCWIGDRPSGCSNTANTSTSCTRGHAAYSWRWGVYYGPLWFCFLVVIICLFSVWRDVKVQEDAVGQYDFARQAASRQERDAAEHVPRRSKIERAVHNMKKKTSSVGSVLMDQSPRTWQVFSQSCFFVVVFYLTYFWGQVNFIYEKSTGYDAFGLLLLHSIFQPLQGFGNFLVYRRPNYLRLRRKHEDRSRWWALKQCLALKIGLPQLPKPIRMPSRSSLKQRLDAIQHSERLSQRQRQLISLAEMGVIPAVTHLFAQEAPPEEPESDDEAEAQHDGRLEED